MLRLGVEAECLRLVFEDLVDDDRAFNASVLDDLTDRGFERLQNNVDARLHVIILALQRLHRSLRTKKRCAAARDDAFFNGSAGCVQRVINAVLLFFHFDFCRTADADHRDAACELRKTLLELLTIIVGGCFFNLRLDLRNTTFDVLLLAGTVDDRGVFLVDADALCTAEHVERD